MKKLFGLFCVLATVSTLSYAQTFTEKVRKSKSGEGSVIFYQEPYLEALLNGTEYPPKDEPVRKTEPVQTVKKNTARKKTGSSDTIETSQLDATKSIASVSDMSGSDNYPDQFQKKVFRNSITVNGYRIRLYSGTNSRESRQKAYSIGYLFKSSYLNVPVYTHFVSPHWTCCVGNFKTYEDAQKFLSELKATNQFNGAMIIKSKIQVSQ